MKKIAHGANNKHAFLFFERTRSLYFLMLVALLAAGVVGYSLALTGETISAQANDRAAGNLVTVEQIGGDELAAFVADDGAHDTSERALFKVCKIAGPGINLNRLFAFTVTGRGVIDAAGTIGDVSRTFDVPAGPPNDGGNCRFVPGFGAGAGNAEFQTFVVGGIVTVTENPEIINSGTVRVSRVRATTPASRPSEFVVNVLVASSLVEVEFTNFRFNPTILKICKIAASTSLLNIPFTFTTTFVSPTGAGGPLFPPFSTTTTVPAGPVGAQGGNCGIVSGAGLIGGAFNIGSTVTITENAAGGTFVSNITSTTSTIPAFVPGVRTTTLSGDDGLVEGVTQVTFTNSNGCNCPPLASPDFDIVGKADSSAFPLFNNSEPDCTCVPQPSQTRTQYDFDGDRKADISVFRPSNGVWYLNNSQTGFYAAQWGASTDALVPGDYDGDGKTDLAVFRKSANSTWYILNSATNTFRAAQWGASNLEQAILFDRPIPGDYDGDGKTDLAVWRLTDAINQPAQFLILQSSNNTGASRQLGGFGDSLVPAADYDGDRRTDFTVRRGSDWHILQSQNNQLRIVQFGYISDKTVPADYDGDGKADVAVVRDGTWYLQRSRDGFLGYQFGLGSDLPVPADYDGDGKADIAVFREGTWYLQRSQAGFTSVAFGAVTDKPVPNVFIPSPLSNE